MIGATGDVEVLQITKRNVVSLTGAEIIQCVKEHTKVDRFSIVGSPITDSLFFSLLLL